MPTARDTPPITLTGLTVDGALPPGLTGRLIRIGDGGVHAVEVASSSAVRYRRRAVDADGGATNLVTFAGRTLALGPGAVPCELDEDLATVRRVDLAGHGRGIGAHPQVDPHTGALHVVSYGEERAHHIVAPNSQTRITVPVPDAPGPLRDLLLTRERFVLLGDGFVGVAERAGQTAPCWITLDLSGAFTAHDSGRDLAVLAASGPLVRSTVAGASARRHVLDDAPQRFGTTNPLCGPVPTYVWTVSDADGTEIHRHDLRTGDRTTHDLGAGRHPGAMTFIPDPTRRQLEAGGWLVGLAQVDPVDQTDVLVLDAAAMDRGPVATVRIPVRIPNGLEGTWIPAVKVI